MPIAPEGWPFIAVAWLVAVVLLVLLPWVGVAWLLVAIWVVAFFRNPNRDGPRGDNLVIAPADGKVVSIIAIDEPSVIAGPAIRVSIFMNVFNVHVNRYPARGTVTRRDYRPGTFTNADREKASLENEHSDIGLASPGGPILVRQIAGSIARRIVTDDGEGTVVTQGKRLGLIRFGSRVDVFLPAGTTILVKEGDVTRAGVTVIAQWK